MVQVRFITQRGPVDIDTAGHASLMQAAKAHGVDGIDADCGGSMVCGTCHVIVADTKGTDLPAPSAMECEILEYVPDPHPDARLSCQLAPDDLVEGMIFEVPALQR